jgi:hypothetical protein
MLAFDLEAIISAGDLRLASVVQVECTPSALSTAFGAGRGFVYGAAQSARLDKEHNLGGRYLRTKNA